MNTSSKTPKRPIATLLTAAGTLVLSLAGCQRIATSPRLPVNEEPMLVDQAMQLRDWDRSDAYYTNTSFVAGPVGFLFEPSYTNPYWSYAVLEFPLFVGQVLALPVTLWLPPPWTPVNYSGGKVEPTYHGMPPLPPPPQGAVEPAPMETSPPAPASENSQP